MEQLSNQTRCLLMFHAYATHTWCQILKRWPLTNEVGVGYCLTNERYSSEILQLGGCSPVKMAGLYKFPTMEKERRRKEGQREEEREGAKTNLMNMTKRVCMANKPADITPSTPVSTKHRSTSLKYGMFPLANTGMATFLLRNKRGTLSKQPNPKLWPQLYILVHKQLINQELSPLKMFRSHIKPQKLVKQNIFIATN